MHDQYGSDTVTLTSQEEQDAINAAKAKLVGGHYLGPVGVAPIDERVDDFAQPAQAKPEAPPAAAVKPGAPA